MNTNIIAEILADEFANDKIDIDIHISILFKIYTKKEIIISHTLQKNAWVNRNPQQWQCCMYLWYEQ